MKLFKLLKIFRIKRVACFMITLVFTFLNISAQDKNLNLIGDSTAVALVENMIYEMGGKSLWKRSRHLYIEQHGWFTKPSGAAVEKTWRDLKEPNRRMYISRRFKETTHVFTPEYSWIKRDGDLEYLSKDQHASFIRGWPNGSYNMLSRFAQGDQNIVLKYEAPYKVIVFDKSGKELSYYEINDQGHMMKWGTNHPSGVVVEYVYGPPKDFGNIKFPAWGTSVDGYWRYNYVSVILSMDPIDSELLARK